jgi:hypothetical protein
VPGAEVGVGGEDAAVEVDRGHVAEAGDGDVQQLLRRGLQVEGRTDVRPGLVEQGQAAAGAGGLALGALTARDIHDLSGHAHGPVAGAQQPVERDGPAAATRLGRQGPVEAQVDDGLAGLQDAVQGLLEPLRLRARQQVEDAQPAQVGRGDAEPFGEGLVDALDHAGPVEQDEAGGGLAEDGLGGGQIGLDPPELAQVHGHADDAAAPVLALGRHQVELGDALGAVAVAVGGGADPLLPGEDLGHPLPAAPPELAGREGGDGVTADGLLGGDVEELGGAVAPLADPPVRADGEGRDPYVVVDGAGLAVTPLRGRRLVHGVAHSFVTSVGIGRG